jgi:soluble lytic murein transglycosylase-like protein
MPSSTLATVLTALAVALPAEPMQSPETYFIPSHRMPGIGAARQELKEEMLVQRTEAMIQSQTFTIMRNPEALPGAQRISSSGLQKLFREGERRSGFPAATLAAMSYLESWGISNAESPAGPRGVMQISEATGRRMGLRITYAVRHRVTKTKTQARNKHGKLVNRTVRHTVAYTVLLKDERLKPDKAIPAAAAYLATLEQHFGGRDWAIWAYHCGEGCVGDFRAMARLTPGLDGASPSVAQVFFGSSPVWNRELYQAIHAQMDRDYSPTYWFRVVRAQQLLAMYENEPAEFRDLVGEYRYRADAVHRAPDRLSAWLKPQDMIYGSPADFRTEQGRRLVRAPDDPAYFGFQVAGLGLAGGTHNDTYYGQAFPSTIGTMAYIAFETRRLFEAMPRGEGTFVPFEVTALVLPMKGDSRVAPESKSVEHSSGQVFDISVARMPERERECLQFVLDDLGWDGCLGFIEESPGSQTLHIGCSPSSREFFGQVFEDGQAALRARNAPAVAIPVESAQP